MRKRRYEIDNLSIELTRRCQLRCAHCLRGEAENNNIFPVYLDEMFKRTLRINSLTLTGGEPSLSTDLIAWTRRYLVSNRVELGSFYLATNGVDISVGFLFEMIQLYAICDYKENCSLALSDSEFHQEEREKDPSTLERHERSLDLLKALSFFSPRLDSEYIRYSRPEYIIDQGRGFDIGRKHRVPCQFQIEKNGIYEEDLYLNVFGGLIGGCDWSYKDQPDHLICHISEFSGKKIRDYNKKVRGEV